MLKRLAHSILHSTQSIGLNGGIIIALVFGVGVLAHSKFVQAKTYTTDAEMIAAWGSERAFGLFSREVDKLHPGDQHSRAHEFGRALYDIEGDSAYTICGSSFHYGCTHGFMSRAFQLHGIQKSQDFFELCKVTPYYPSCVHGIGHGIVSSLGYDEESLTRALDMCHTSVPEDVVMGCAGGAIMEYTQQGVNPEARTFSVLEHGYYAVCDAVEEHSRVLCHFWLPDWWRREEKVTPDGTPIDDFPALGRHCGAIRDMENRHSCFAGIGYTIASAFRYSAVEAIELCESVSEEKYARLYCKGTAAFIFHADSKTKDGSDQLCRSAHEARDVCLSMMKEGPKDFLIPLP